MNTQTNSPKVTLFVHDSGSHCRFSIAEDGTITEIHTGGIDAARVLRSGKADLTGAPEEIRAEVERAFRIGDGCEDYGATIEDATPQPEQEQQETAAPADSYSMERNGDAPKNDADTLMAECREREAKQRAEIASTPVRGCEEMRRREAATPVRLVREEMGMGFVMVSTETGAPSLIDIPEHRATAFVSGLQQARIDALEAALRAVESNMRGDGYFERTCRQAVDSALA